MAKRDYSPFGADARQAVQSGLTAAEWYHTEVPRKVMKDLMARSDSPAIRDTLLLYGLMIALAAGGIATWGSLWTVPFWLAYGVLYGSASDSRWHECSHGTAFRTPWMNNAVYQIASFMIMRNAATWRWSHARHHSETYFVGRDPEIAVMRPPEMAKLILNFFGVLDVLKFFPNLIRNAVAGPTTAEKTFVPQSEWGKVQKVALVHLAIYLATITLALWLGSILPLMVIGLPRMYGAWHHVMTGLLQHGGLADNVIDHRLNSRTVYMNPVSRFIYWNMNYHVEHHMFPMVPYHALPRLHAAIKADLPAPNRSIAEGFAEMWPALKRQLAYEDYFLKRELPASAKPYREDFHLYVPGMMAQNLTPKAAE
ncbi:fatty acid desaturase family protein [Tabrizicola oligotrophica]|uniref:Fatty acid desaturase family protein n=1 Tax=Tabrizicola oligotrophica TaxID=2710650 RepID=A0A6M0QXA1_9RHOB|nr:fatty acid desaturase family protein [Tabrizicola oligotrophica]NEY92126.1 fatty acid desaturase family protein [Tabrizicola oligotrophica]